MILPPPESSSTTHSPEAFVAIVTLILIGCAVYGLGKIRLSSLKSLYRAFFRRSV